MPGGYRRWCFTINNPAVDQPWAALPEDVAYIVWQKEQGAQGTMHLQGYTRVKKSLSIGAVKTALAIPTAHLEHANGTEEQCKAYCTKVETRIAGPWELGDYLPSQGQRNDLKKCAALIVEGKSLAAVADAEPATFVKYARGFAALKAALSVRKMRPDVEVLVIWGPTGVGKSHWAWNHFPLERLFAWNANSGHQWFDGYAGEEILIIDEFSGEQELAFLNRVLDKYPLTVEMKGSSIDAKWTKVIITSNIDPANWYSSMAAHGRNTPERIASLLRRLTWIHNPQSRAECSAIPIPPQWL